MTMPHVCRCEKCGREMPELTTVIDNKTSAGIAPGFVAPALSMFPAHICRHGEPDRTCALCFPHPTEPSR